jgi:hypothetical protein
VPLFAGKQQDNGTVGLKSAPNADLEAIERMPALWS